MEYSSDYFREIPNPQWGSFGDNAQEKFQKIKNEAEKMLDNPAIWFAKRAELELKLKFWSAEDKELDKKFEDLKKEVIFLSKRELKKLKEEVKNSQPIAKNIFEKYQNTDNLTGQFDKTDGDILLRTTKEINKDIEAFNEIKAVFADSVIQKEITEDISQEEQEYKNLLKEINIKVDEIDSINVNKFNQKQIEKSLKKLPENISKITDNKKLLELIAHTHEEINAHNLQSDGFRSMYSQFSNSLNEIVLERLSSLPDSEEKRRLLLGFSQIITWRKSEFGSWSIDSNLKSPDIALKLLWDAMLAKWWAIDELISKWKINFEDKKMEWKEYKKVINDPFFTEEKDLWLLEKFDMQEILGIKLSDIDQGKKYSELSFEQKAKIWTMLRFQEKMKSNSKETKELTDSLNKQKQAVDLIKSNKKKIETIWAKLWSNQDKKAQDLLNNSKQDWQTNNQNNETQKDDIKNIDELLTKLKNEEQELKNIENKISTANPQEKKKLLESLVKIWESTNKYEQKLPQFANQVFANLANVFNNIAREAQAEILSDTVDKISKSDISDLFDSKTEAQELWLSWVNWKIYDLFYGINWNWLFNLSDQTKQNITNFTKTAAIMAATIAVAFVVTAATWGAWAPVALAMLYWAVASTATSMVLNTAINWQWYDSVWELSLRATTELWLNYTWMLTWWLLTKWGWVLLWKVMSNPATAQTIWQVLPWVNLASKEWMAMLFSKEGINKIAPIILKEASIDVADFSLWTVESYLVEKYIHKNNVSLSDIYVQWFQMMLLGKVGWYAVNKFPNNGFLSNPLKKLNLSQDEVKVLWWSWLLWADGKPTIAMKEFKNALADIRKNKWEIVKEELSAWSIKEAKNIDELKQIIENSWWIEWNSWKYTPEQLNSIVDDFISWKIQEDNITRAWWLRDKIVELRRLAWVETNKKILNNTNIWEVLKINTDEWELYIHKETDWKFKIIWGSSDYYIWKIGDISLNNYWWIIFKENWGNSGFSRLIKQWIESYNPQIELTSWKILWKEIPIHTVRNAWMEWDSIVEKINTLYKNNIEFLISVLDNDIAAWHGSCSSSLLWVIEHGLKPQKYLQENDIQIASGEQSHSSAWFSSGNISLVNWALEESLMMYSWWTYNKISAKSIARDIDLQKKSAIKIFWDLEPNSWNLYKESKLIKIQNLENLQKYISKKNKTEYEQIHVDLIKENFPVIYLLKNWAIDHTKKSIPNSDIKWEFLLEWWVWSDWIWIICVPKDKVEKVKKLVESQGKNMDVFALEDYYWNKLPIVEQYKNNAKLDDSDRLKSAEYLLTRNFSDNDKQIILNSHYLKDPTNPDAWVGEYSMQALAMKYRILTWEYKCDSNWNLILDNNWKIARFEKTNNFSSEEIRILMEKGICGEARKRTDNYKNYNKFEEDKANVVIWIKFTKENLNIKDFSYDLERFDNSIDIKYFNDIDKVFYLLENIENMFDYIIDNKNIIDNNIEIKNDIRLSLNSLRRKLLDYSKNWMIENTRVKQLLWQILTDEKLKQAHSILIFK